MTKFPNPDQDPLAGLILAIFEMKFGKSDTQREDRSVEVIDSVTNAIIEDRRVSLQDFSQTVIARPQSLRAGELSGNGRGGKRALFEGLNTSIAKA
jgi:hypothetical protein